MNQNIRLVSHRAKTLCDVFLPHSRALTPKLRCIFRAPLSTTIRPNSQQSADTQWLHNIYLIAKPTHLHPLMEHKTQW
uniref:Uncharacterized protein n=1 Tax=Anguilla anguilla TaxID=7936 RepID=A0A0E9V813_ANGAN